MGGRMMVAAAIFMVVAVSLAAGSPDRHQKWWKCRGGPSSIVLPLYGNVYPNGFYFAQVDIGNPPRPYFVDPDTGSDLTWLQCDAPCVHCTRAPHPYYKPNNDLVICKDPLCASLHLGDYTCEDPQQCDYEVEYADGGSSLGVLLNDVFHLNLTNGVKINPHLALGCGYDQVPGTSHHPLDGILGLGRGKSSVVTQLWGQGLVRNVIGHCLSGRGGGYLFLGDEVYDASRITWTPMKHYSPGPAELTFGGKSTGAKNMVVVFDSGSSYSYFISQPYEAFLYSVVKELRGKPLREARDDPTLPFCWKGRKPFRSISDVKKYFKPFALSFANGWRSRTLFDISPESYLIISSMGSVCLGILNGTEAGLHTYNLIGDVSMQDKMVIYDNEKSAIGWTRANCDRPPAPNLVFI
nr:aspartic proteinase Asp1 [Ipomoea batatas]